MNRTGPLALILLAFSAPVFAAESGRAVDVTVSLRPLQVTHHYFAQIESQQNYVITASLAGRLSHLQVRPGDPVHKGEVLAQLSGPAVQAERVIAKNRVKTAQSQYDMAKAIYGIRKHEYQEQITTHVALIKAHDALVQAQSRLATAESHAQSLSNQVQLLAPVDGNVTGLLVANAAFVKAGQPLMKILPAKGLWLASRVFGADGSSVHVGQKGWFVPDGSTAKIPVTVASVVSDPKVAGIRHVYLTTSVKSIDWMAGQAGTVALSGPTRTLPAVPSPALILDQGAWWVMVRRGNAWVPVQVHPVASRDGWTWLRPTLQSGQRVLVQGAYQAFHRDFAKRYANPD